MSLPQIILLTANCVTLVAVTITWHSLRRLRKMLEEAERRDRLRQIIRQFEHDTGSGWRN